MNVMSRAEAEHAANRELLRAREDTKDWEDIAFHLKSALALALSGEYIPQPQPQPQPKTGEMK